MTEFYVTDRSYNLLGIFSTTSGKFDTAVAEDIQKIEESMRTFQATINWAPSQAVDEPDELTNQAVSMFKEGNFVLYVDKQGKSVWTTIYEVNMDTEDGQADITCQDAGIDLINELVAPYVPDKQYTIAQYIERFTKDSGFEIGVNEIPKLSRKLQGWESTETALARIISVATQFDNAELDFSFEVQGLDVVKKYINIYKKRGGGDNTTLYVGKEINKITVKSDIYDLATAIYPQGGTEEGKDTPVTLKGYKWTDPDKRFVLGADGVLRDTVAVQKWSRLLSNENPNPTKAHIITRKDYETTNQKTLLDNALRNLKEVNEPAVNYEVDIVELPANVNIGDTINLVNEKRELYLSARVLELTYDYCYGTGTAVLGDYLIQEGRIDTSLQDLANSLKERVDSMREEVKAKTKYIKSTTPPSEHENVIWIDTSKTPNIMKTWNEATQSWDKATPDAPGEVGAYPNDKGDVLEENVNVIHNDVEHVKGDIKDLGDDSKLTPVEKKAVALEIENIKATYNELVKQATKVDVDITDYGNKYKALLAYIQPLLDAVNVNSVIVPVTYKAKFTDYYSAEQNAKNLIGDKIIQLAEQGDENTQLVANTYTDSEIKKADKEIRLAVNQYTDVVAQRVEDKVDGLEYENRNYLLNTNSEIRNVNWTGWDKKFYFSNELFKKISVGDSLTLRVYIDKPSVDLNAFIQFDTGTSFLQTKGTTVKANESGYSIAQVKITQQMLNAVSKTFAIRNYANSTASTGYYNEKLEKGSKPTAYSQAPEDLIDEAVVIAKKYTDTHINLIPGQITAGVKESKEYADNAANGALAGSKSYTDNAIKITKKDIELKADKNGLIGLINVSPETIKLNASKIDLQGKVTFNSFDSAAQKRITDAESNASTAKTDASSAKNTASTANTNATTAKNDASSAKTTANTALTNANTANTNANAAKGTATTASTNASNALNTVNGWKMTGKTTIDGGKIEADSISVAALKAGMINANDIILQATSGSKKVKLDGSGFSTTDNNGKLRMTIGVQDIAGDGQSDPSNIVFYSGNGKNSVSVGTNVEDTFVIGTENTSMMTMIRTRKQVMIDSNSIRMYNPNTNHFFEFKAADSKHQSIQPDTDATGLIGYPTRKFAEVNTVEANSQYLNVGVGDPTVSADFYVGKKRSGPLVQSLATYNRTYSGSADVCITTKGTLGRRTSARKYKTDIQPMALTRSTPDKRILNMQPSSWLDKAELQHNGMSNRYYGFIADDFDKAGLKEVVQYGADGEVEGLAYDRLSIYMIPILRDQEQKISDLESELEILRKELTT